MSLAFSSDMASVCGEQQQQQHQHNFHPSHQLCSLNKKTLRELDIPPRKLLSRRAAADVASDMFMDSPKGEDAIFQKFLPYNNADDDDADPYSADHFRMYEFKVRKCTRSRSHDWTDCPFAHPGEKARRRDPRRYNYSGTVCSEFRRGNCSRGDNCEFAHGVFECWLHPSRYRTEACKDGKNCKRKICFFAHTPRQLRILPVNCNENVSSPVISHAGIENKSRPFHHCCVCCHSVSASPTSTLMGMSHLSPPMSPCLSPPHSPAKFSPVSRFSDQFENESCGLTQFNPGGMTYKDALTELMSSLEAMNVNKASSHAATTNSRNLSWVDVNFNSDDQPQFVLSPSTPSAGSSRFFKGEQFGNRGFTEDNNKNNDNGLAGPDIGWVNDLLT